VKNLTWQNPEQLFVAQELIKIVKLKCCGIKDVMKKFYVYAMLFMSMCLFTACPSDEDDDAPIRRDFTEQPFAGYWDCAKKMLFYENGTGIIPSSGESFVWQYDKSTRILSTTASDYQWEVTLIDSMAWTGIKLWGDRSSVTNRRIDPRKTAYLLLTDKEWISNDTIWKFSSVLDDYSELKLSYSEQNGFYNPFIYHHDHFCSDKLEKIKESIAEDKITVHLSHSLSNSSTSYSKYSCDISIDHPYSHENIKATCYVSTRHYNNNVITEEKKYYVVLRPYYKKK